MVTQKSHLKLPLLNFISLFAKNIYSRTSKMEVVTELLSIDGSIIYTELNVQNV